MGWCFAKINNRLGEIYFDEGKNGKNKITGHCYVDIKTFKTKQEKRWIEIDTKKYRLTYRNKKYLNQNEKANKNKKSQLRFM